MVVDPVSGDTETARLLRWLVTETNRTLGMIVTAKSVSEIRWGSTACALMAAQRHLEELDEL